MDDENCSYSTTIEATIEIDDDVVQGINAKEICSRKRGPWIRPPLRLEDVRVRCPDSLRIRDLSDEALTLLSSHLNMPSYGTLKNWDSVGIQLGISDHEIMSFRHDPRPMEAVLKKCRDRPAKDLIKALQLCKRIDILYSLRKFQRQGNLEKPIEREFELEIDVVCVRLMHMHTKRTLQKLLDYTRLQHQLLLHFVIVLIQAVENVSESWQGADILLVHYEDCQDETKNFKWLRKNLRQYASQRGFGIVDIAELDVDANLMSTVEDAFIKAHQIVVTFTPSHIEAVKSRSAACRSVVYTHDLMNQEFFTLNSINKRFRAVIFNDTQPSDLPVGWPRSTLVYHFPTNMSALCTKIFIQTDIDNTSTL
ncbi:hypothetical protein ANCDUO_06987 [Ancylostoma duodenale]|uniref:Death domain protein n=1 Tax=Ancylostoma duodenale TaxID=51022 RepID=A0A0C2H045_9BILA|nr:hypothetical protein ANCDUO_06987 [Ancylostoma duodenale]